MMPTENHLQSPRLQKIIKQLNKMTLQESILLRDYMNDRIELVKRSVPPRTNIRELGLSGRALFFLARLKLNTVQDVLNYGFENLLLRKGLGEVTYNEICMTISGKIDFPFRR